MRYSPSHPTESCFKLFLEFPGSSDEFGIKKKGWGDIENISGDHRVMKLTKICRGKGDYEEKDEDLG